ncbi:MAG: C10 family peptidase [Desulfobacteraceae bacterium]|jgi:hypothetical protein|nr:C10 family peptidase [Desulfobacteraceae bacterium]
MPVRKLLFCLLTLFFFSSVCSAKVTTIDQARTVVTNWLTLDVNPMDAKMGLRISNIEIYNDSSANTPLYYVVKLDPEGFVIVSADDLVEPIVGFTAQGAYDSSLDNPWGALVSNDLAGRIENARTMAAKGKQNLEGTLQNAKAKWDTLLAIDPMEEAGLGSISDIRVAPLIQSRWNQSSEWGSYCYNYYTPNHYVCGCVATALAQRLRYDSYLVTGVGTTSFTIEVNGTPQSRNLRGGDGAGGPYDWANMVLDPDASILEIQRQAIGALTHDAGVAVEMSYTSSWSGADTLDAATALKNTFGYSNAIKGYNYGSNIWILDEMANPNLDADNPVILGITGSSGGHAIIADGYGYNLSTLYHHLNMGWSGSSDAWYNLPTIDSSPSFTVIYKCIFNIFKTGSGEIISGRVVDTNGDPLEGASISAVRGGGGTYTATTNSNGIYALQYVPSDSTYQISVSKSGYIFLEKTISNSDSGDYQQWCGNEWGINFEAVPPPPPDDFGDAPSAAQSGFASSYPTLLTDDGARHFAAGPTLGANRDTESDGQSSVNADGDDTNGSTPDDEDGVAISGVITALISGTNTSTVDVNLQNSDGTSNLLDAWIDFNRDGDWDDSGEQIFTSYDLGTIDSVHTLTFTIPQATGGAVEAGDSYARFRLSTSGSLSPTGAADDGEIEDCLVTLAITVDVPDVLDTAQASAESSITAAGLTLGTITTTCNNTIISGNIISSDPTAGTSLPSGTAVDLVVSTGPCPVVNWSADSQTVLEDVGTVTLTATLNMTAGSDVTVPYTVSGTATGGGTDHDLANGSIIVSAGNLSESETFNVTDDSDVEGDETVIVTMGTPINADQGTTTVHTVTITNNDISGGSGTDTIGVYDPATRKFYLRNSNSNGTADVVFGYGGSEWTPLVGDWDGDGVDTIGVYDPATRKFYLRNSNDNGVADVVFGYGGSGWTPITGDWDNL